MSPVARRLSTALCSLDGYDDRRLGPGARPRVAGRVGFRKALDTTREAWTQSNFIGSHKPMRVRAATRTGEIGPQKDFDPPSESCRISGGIIAHKVP